MHLLKSIRVVIAIESTEYQLNAFAQLAEKHVIIRVALWFHRVFKRLGISHLFVMLYGVKEFVGLVFPKSSPQVLGMAVFGNEVKHVEYLKDRLPPGAMENVRFTLLNPSGVIALVGLLAHPRAIIRFLRVFKKIERDLPFLPACRLAGSLMMYVRFRHYFKSHAIKAVAYASAYGPSACAVIAAANAQGIKTIYISHAYLPISDHRYLKEHDLAIYDSKAMSARHTLLGFKVKNEVYRGILGESRQMEIAPLGQTNYSMGIFLTGFSITAAISELVQVIRKNTNGTILIRCHPVDFSNPDMGAVAAGAPNVTITRGTPIFRDIKQCDLVAVGNTTAALEVLKHGVPTVHIGGLDSLVYDFNGLVNDDLIPGYERSAELNLQEIIRFYSASDWADKFSYYDGAYGLSQDAVDRNVRQAVEKLIG